DAPADLGRHLAKLFRLRLVSETTDSVDCEPGQLDKQCTADLESVRRILIGYIRSEHQEHYRRLLREGKLAALAAAPLKPVSRLTVCYRLGEREIKDSRNLHAHIDDKGFYVLSSGDVDHEQIAESLQRSLGRIPALVEVLVVLLAKPSGERESYAQRRGYVVPDEEWQRLLTDYQPPPPEPGEATPQAGEDG